MVVAIDTAGVPDTPNGAQAATAISDWADATRDDIEDAQDSLDNEADTLSEAIAQLTDVYVVLSGPLSIDHLELRGRNASTRAAVFERVDP